MPCALQLTFALVVNVGGLFLDGKMAKSLLMESWELSDQAVFLLTSALKENFRMCYGFICFSF